VHGIDGTIYQYNSAGAFPAVGLEFQAKCTETVDLNQFGFSYDLPVGNYNRLVQDELPTLPAILIVLLVPHDVSTWVDHMEERLLVRQCAYWGDYRGLPPSANFRRKRVRLDRANRFGVDELVEMMDRVTRDDF
jgi:hypothetical protein